MSQFLNITHIYTVDENDANRLLKYGWQFLQAIVTTRGDSHFLSGSDIRSHVLIVMGRPDFTTIPEPLESEYSVWSYLKRLKEQSVCVEKSP